MEESKAETRPIESSVVRVAAGLLCAAIVAVGIWAMAGVLQPFVVALMLCFLVHPIVSSIARQTHSKVLGNVLALVLISGAFSLCGQIVASDLSRFSEHRRVYDNTIKQYREALEERFAGSRFEVLIPNVDTLMEPTQLARWAGLGTSAFLDFTSQIVIIVFFMFLILIELDRFPRRVKLAFPPDRAEQVIKVAREITTSVHHYIGLKVLVSLMTAILSAIVMKLFGLHYVTTFAILVFLLNFIPYLGSVIATVAPLIIALLQFDSPWPAVWLGGALIAVQQVIGNLVEPRIQGKGLNISPVVILLSLGFWGSLWGIIGMLVAIPITVTGRIVLEQFASTRYLAALISDVPPKDADPPSLAVR